jgi:hypothetical protein
LSVTTLVFLHHADLMLNALMEFVHVCLNTKAMHILDVDQNALSITIVPETKHAFETNVLILVLELVDKELFAK